MTDWNRRHFMSHLAGSAAMVAGGLPFWPKLAAAEQGNKKYKSIIILWMGSGPSHMDLWTIKTGSANQGAFEAIKTSAAGIEISEAMPKMAAQMKHMVRIESLNSHEGDRQRGTIRMLTGFQAGSLGGHRPHIGSLVSYYVGNPDSPLRFVSTAGAAAHIGAGVLGPAFAPLPVQNPGTTPENIRLPQLGDPAQTMARTNARKDVLGILEDNFRGAVAPHLIKEEDRKAFADASQAHAELINKALDISLKAGTKMFEFGAEDNKLLAEYGNNGFGRGCLLARKLVEAGVSAVQVDLGGWDMHGNIADGIRRLATGTLDPAFAALIKDLNQRGLYKDTLVVWMGPFGRTPRLQDGVRRAPWSNGWTIVLGGAGLKQGVSYGETDGDGLTITRNPVSVHQLYATMYTALGIDLGDRNLDLHDNVGRRVLLAGETENAGPIKELLA
jgi:Protein of unknown function (DUF1501)